MWNAQNRRSWMVTLIIFINVIVFINWMTSDRSSYDWMAQNFLVSWDAVQDGRYWVLLTSVFSHNMFLHILLNMFVLNSFGRVLEMMLGSFRFLRFYLFAGVFSSICHAIVSNFVMDKPDLPALGASGAIAGVILVFSLAFPRERILLFGLISMPAIVGALLFVGLDIWGLIAQAQGGGLPIGHGAHLGGALAGFIYYLFIRNKS